MAHNRLANLSATSFRLGSNMNEIGIAARLMVAVIDRRNARTTFKNSLDRLVANTPASSVLMAIGYSFVSHVCRWGCSPYVEWLSVKRLLVGQTSMRGGRCWADDGPGPDPCARNLRFISSKTSTCLDCRYSACPSRCGPNDKIESNSWRDDDEHSLDLRHWSLSAVVVLLFPESSTSAA